MNHSGHLNILIIEVLNTSIFGNHVIKIYVVCFLYLFICSHVFVMLFSLNNL